MEVKPNMIINNYFHGEFSQAEAAESWKRDRPTLEGGALTDHSSSGCRNLLIQIRSETFFLLFWLNLTLVVFLMCVLGMVSKQSEREQQQKLTPHRPSASFLCMALWHTDSFTWWETRHEATGFYHNRITTSPSLSLSLFHARRHKQPELHWLIFFVFFWFSYICVIEFYDEVVTTDKPRLWLFTLIQTGITVARESRMLFESQNMQ